MDVLNNKDIEDAVGTTQELIHTIKSSKKRVFIMKIDLSKDVE